MSLVRELQRRNVIRMAGLYLVGAWLLVQVASTLFPAFGVPGWALRALVITLALGFVPALVFAWVFELTPDGLRRDDDIPPEQSIAAHTGRRMNRLIVAVLALAVIYFCVDKFVLAPRREAALVLSTAQTAKAEASTEARQEALDNSIAVLPFVNMSDDKDNQFFSDGISEELLNVLVRVDGLSVASRTSSFALRDKSLSSQAIGRALNVSHVLEGSVRKAGNKVRITAQLIDAVHDRHLWSKTYDRELTDIFAIQDEIAKAIVDALRGTMEAEKAQQVVAVRADTENMQAYELYLKARENFIARRDLGETIKMFERVVELDPKFARGWEGLAATAAIARSWGFDDRDYNAMVTPAAERALQLDPKLSMPWAAMAQVGKSRWPIDWTRTLEQYEKALIADPRNATALLWRGIAWTELGFFDKAIADLDRCLALEPGYFNCERHKALALLFAGRDEPAIALFNHGIAQGFASSRNDNFVAPILARGDRSAALLMMDEQKIRPELRELIIKTLEESAPPSARYRALVDRYVAMKDDPMVNTVGLSRIYLWLGDYDRVATIDDAVTTAIVAWDRYPASFRNSPGMKLKLQRMGVPAYWRAKGFPPQCHRAGATDFNCD